MFNKNYSAANSSIVKTSNEASVNSISNPSNEAMASKEVKSTKRAHKVEPIYRVMAKARNQFNKQVRQDTETKILCIKNNIKDFYKDGARFWADLNKEVEDLMDSKRFNEYCEKCGRNAQDVAQHLVFEGKAAKNRVLKGEFTKDLKNIHLFDSPLYEAPDKAEKIA